MNTDPYGFNSVANRYAYIFNQAPPPVPAPHQIVPLDRLVRMIYGDDFAERPRLKNLAILNSINIDNFLDGPDEAKLFELGDFYRISSSLRRKLQIIAALAERLIDGTLDTKRLGRRVPFVDSNLESMGLIFAIASRVRRVATDLYRRTYDRPLAALGNEIAFQDLFHGLLRLFFDDIRREDFIPQNAGSGSRIDFRLPDYKIGIELKDASKWNDNKIGEQLSIDKQRYAANPDIRHLLCLVFDYDRILDNPRGLESTLSGPASNDMIVHVRIFQD